jgi:hypothetical protein
VPSNDYSVVIDLAAIRYAEADPYSYSKDVSSTFSEWLDQNADVDDADLTMVALADPDYLTLPNGNVKTLRVDLAKIRAAKRYGVVDPLSPFDYLRDHDGKAPFSFGLQSFTVRTGERTGNGVIAISIWADGKPVDELTLTLCIVGSAAEPCRGSLSASNQYAGVDLTMRTVYPDLAVHLIDATKSVKGVLRCNSCGWADNDYREWDLVENAKWVDDRIKEITKVVGDVASANTSLDKARPEIEKAGEDLYNVIFHALKPNDKAKAAFAAFMTRAQTAESSGMPPPSLFVRIIPERQPDLTLAPIGLMRARPENGPADFVGFVANVQTPLEYQNYSEAMNCLSQWLLFVPPELPKGGGLKEVQQARGEFEDWIGAFRKTCPGCVIEEENTFQHWLNEERAPREPRAVAILSHHAANALYFDANRPKPVLSSAITRRFANPSFVLLNACGTSEPGASEFIRQFNRNGMNTAIATSTIVDPVLAGKFLTEFMDQLKRNVDDPGYTVSRARFDAVRTLGRSTKSEYGPKALAFILAGNGAIRLCVPGPQ